jgi:tetratricopeptide (TPR) repeat protein
MVLRSCIGVSLLIALAAPARTQAQGAEADPDVAAARSHYDAAVSYYEQLRYEDAAREFREAYELSRRAHLLKNVGTSLQHARQWGGAADAFAEYLRELPGADDREGIEGRIARLRELAASEARGEETAEEDIPEAGTLETDDGSAGPAPSAVAPEDDGAPVVPIVLTVSGAVLGVAALVVGLMAHGVYTDLDDRCPDDRCTDARAADDRDRGETLAVTSTVLTGLAVAVGATGILLWLLDGGSAEERDPSLGAYVAPGGAGFVLRGEL